MIPDCNRCEPAKRCSGGYERGCTNYRPPKDTWMLAEMALAYPDSLNEALSALPFKCNLDFYLRR